MEENNVHIVQKQYYDIGVSSERDGMAIQKELLSVNDLHILPALHKKLDDFFSADAITIIDKLELNLGVLKSNTAPGEWVEKFLAELEKAVKFWVQAQYVEGSAGDKVNNKTEHAILAWVYYLKTGVLMQDSIFTDLPSLKQVIFTLPDPAKKELKVALLGLAYSQNVLLRIVQLKKKEVFAFIHLLAPVISGQDWDIFLNSIGEACRKVLSSGEHSGAHEVARGERHILVMALAEIIDHTRQSSILIPPVIAQWIANPSSLEGLLEKWKVANMSATGENPGSISREDKDKADQGEDELPVKSIFISNAGLCLVAPYLPMFFTALDLHDGNRFKSTTHQQRAIYLVHFLATGMDNGSEEILVFPKLLCGWPLQMPCVLESPLSPKEMDESDSLLESVIAHWPALKNTSPDGLRDAFLQRGGKLIGEEDHYLLQPEHKTMDILLDTISWSFRTCRLPWMKKMIKVEWY